MTLKPHFYPTLTLAHLLSIWEPSCISQLTTTTITKNLLDSLVRSLICRTSVAYVALRALPFTWLLLQPNRFSDQ
jgi:hypothetical protein